MNLLSFFRMQLVFFFFGLGAVFARGLGTFLEQGLGPKMGTDSGTHFSEQGRDFFDRGRATQKRVPKSRYRTRYRFFGPDRVPFLDTDRVFLFFLSPKLSSCDAGSTTTRIAAAQNLKWSHQPYIAKWNGLNNTKPTLHKTFSRKTRFASALQILSLQMQWLLLCVHYG